MAVGMMERRGMRAAGRHDKAQQSGLFESNRCEAIIGTPAWLELPVEIQNTLMSLLARLILDHARLDGAALSKEVGDDL